MSISSTGIYGSATFVNSDLFNDVESLKEQVTTLSTSYLTTTQEHRDDISQNRWDISTYRFWVRAGGRDGRQGESIGLWSIWSKKKAGKLRRLLLRRKKKI